MPFVLAFFLLALVPAQRPTDVVKWAAVPPAAQVETGGVVRVTVTAKVQAGWKLYAIDQPPGGPVPLTFDLADGARFAIAAKEIVAPKAKVQKQDANFAVDTKYYEQDASFTIPVSVPPAATAGAHTIPLEITFQACGAQLCLRPFTEKLAVPITVRR
jgi:DsbC/DsbD-like thiol-disulfide interchange protein